MCQSDAYEWRTTKRADIMPKTPDDYSESLVRDDDPQSQAGSSKSSERSKPLLPDFDTASDPQLRPQADAKQLDNVPQPQTPPMLKAVMNFEAYGKADDVREAVLKDIGASIKEVTVDSFIRNLLPKWNLEINVEDIVRRLKEGATPVLGEKGWEAFDASRGVSNIETIFYKPFSDIIDSILATVPDILPRNFAYVQLPDKSPLDTTHLSSQQPDGYGYLLHRDGDPQPEKDGNHYWRRIVVCAEFKKTDKNGKDRNKNVAQVCGNMNQVMRDDPTRRFTYGFTLEKFSLRMWYCSRSDVVVSVPFDIMKDYTSLIRFILLLAHPLSLSDIGFDLTMIGPTEGNFNYDVQVHCADGQIRTFRTSKLINGMGARALRGGGTRVWEAVEIVNGAPCREKVALKDTWIDSDRTREGDIIAEILRDAKTGTEGTLKEGLLTVLCHGDVMIADVQDTTRIVKADGRFPMRIRTRGDKIIENRSLTSRQQTGSYIGREYDDFEALEDIEYEQKTHYRIVFQEVGQPLYEVEHLQDAFDCLKTVADVLSAMQKAQWVHRDVSANNIIWVNHVGKLADLEYARKESDNTCHKIRTTSTFFLAVEVEKQAYRFAPPRSRLKLVSSKLIQDSTGILQFMSRSSKQRTSDVDKELMSASETQVITQPLFRYNPLHDLESLWWIAVFLLFYKEASSKKTTDDRDVSEIRKKSIASIQLFERMQGRYDFLLDNHQLLSYDCCIHRSVRFAWDALETLRAILIYTYKTVEVEPQSITFEGITKTFLHNDFHICFDNISKNCPEIKVSRQRRQDLESHPNDTKSTHAATGITTHMQQLGARIADEEPSLLKKKRKVF